MYCDDNNNFPGHGNMQVSPLCVMSVMLVVYGMIQPYKNRTTNIVEMLVQINFILLLTLESSGYLKDTNVDLNSSGVSTVTAILLPFYYLPIVPFIVTAGIKFIIYIR